VSAWWDNAWAGLAGVTMLPSAHGAVRINKNSPEPKAANPCVCRCPLVLPIICPCHRFFLKSVSLAMQTSGQPRLGKPNCQENPKLLLRKGAKCSTDGETTLGACEAGFVCMKKNDFYGECLKPDDVKADWDGSIIAGSQCSVRSRTVLWLHLTRSGALR
jgi:hypothetical protein